MAAAEPSSQVGQTEQPDRFPLARRGYETENVDRFVASMSERIKRLQGQVEWLRARSEHFERRSASANEAAYARVARDFVELLRQAEQEAQRIRAEGQDEARRLIDAAHREADHILAEGRRARSDLRPASPAPPTTTASPTPATTSVAPADAGGHASGESAGQLKRTLWAEGPGPPDPPLVEAVPAELWQPVPNGKDPADRSGLRPPGAARPRPAGAPDAAAASDLDLDFDVDIELPAIELDDEGSEL